MTMTQPPPNPNYREGNMNRSRESDNNAMDVDDELDFLNGPDADDFGSDYESAADDISPQTAQTPAPKLDLPPAYSAAAPDTQEDLELAIALSASMTSATPSRGMLSTFNNNPWSQTSGTGVSRASAQAAQHEPRRTSTNDSYSRTRGTGHEFSGSYAAATSVGAPRQSINKPTKPMCVVCEARPAFDNGYRHFPTCGNTCARLLEEAQKAVPKPHLPPSSNHGQIGGPREGTSSNQPSKNTPIKMCKVCRERPVYQRNGKIYPTCGLKCAAKLQAPGSAPMCEYCHERPKVVINDKIFPHCGRTCRDKANPGGTAHYYTTRSPPAAENKYRSSASMGSSSSAQPGSLSSACTTCIFCWAAPRFSDRDDFCSDVCKDVAGQQGPFLLEIPRGHASFQGVEQHCINNWNTKQASYPLIKRIYMVQPHLGFDAAFKKYRMQVSSAVSPSQNGNEARQWLAPSRRCSLGDGGTTTPCDSTKCMLCSLVRASAKAGTYSGGIWTTSSLEQGVDWSTEMAKGRGNTLLLAQVLLGKPCDKTKNELEGLRMLPPAGYGSIRLVQRTMLGWGKSEYRGEHIVFDGRAIKPLYLITFE